MHTAEEAEILSQSGPGTLVGNLLRRYWTPACLSLELPEPETTVRVRLLGEDLVAYRDAEGKVGLLGEHCPHRGASLYFGRNEELGLRCVYHGWKFDLSGQCVDMPSEKRSFVDQIKATAYPTHESGGIVWTYMGPLETMTPFRDFGTESLTPDEISVTKEYIGCNWVQSLDGDLDGSHVSYLHSRQAMANFDDDGTDKPGYPSTGMRRKLWMVDRAPRLEVHDEWHGFRYAAVRETPNGHTHVRTYAYVMPYGALIAMVPFNTRQLMIVPIDDTHAMRYTVVTQPPDDFSTYSGQDTFVVEVLPERQRNGVIEREYTAENEYQIDRENQRTTTYTGIADGRAQDLMVTESMGPRYDRTEEHWGTTDAALIRMHMLLLSAAQGLAEGNEPPALADGLHDFRSIRAAEKILAAGEDWRDLGTDNDPVVEAARQTQ